MAPRFNSPLPRFAAVSSGYSPGFQRVAGLNLHRRSSKEQLAYSLPRRYRHNLATLLVSKDVLH